jgi:parvulin-like peptidyl-prolyl isomerase
LILVAVILAIGAGLVVWKKKVGGGSESFNSISKQEIELLLADAAEKNPMALKRLAEDPELKKKQTESLKQLLAFATAAQKEGYASEPSNRQELDNIRAEITAVNYDQEINKDKGPMPPFGFITEDQMNQFWGEDQNPSAGPGFVSSLLDKIGLSGTAAGRTHQAEFDQFLETKIKLLKESNPQMAEREISDEEKQQAREFFSKVKIYQKEYETKAKAGELSKEFQDKVDLQVKLQQAQFLARIYSDKLAEKIKATDDDIAAYIAQHPELDPSQKKAKAVEVLNRAKAGEDFATLANEFSEDPGNKDPKGEPQGGLYKDVQKGRMVKPFEEAALALEPGQVAPDVVESDFGFHIIKLEKKADSKDSSGNPSQVYDVRHILISTSYQDPENPGARPMPVKQYVRQKLETEREKEIVDNIIASSGVTVAEDFEIPQISDEKIQEMMKKQQPSLMEPEAAPDEKPAAADKKKTK